MPPSPKRARAAAPAPDVREALERIMRSALAMGAVVPAAMAETVADCERVAAALDMDISALLELADATVKANAG